MHWWASWCACCSLLLYLLIFQDILYFLIMQDILIVLIYIADQLNAVQSISAHKEFELTSINACSYFYCKMCLHIVVSVAAVQDRVHCSATMRMVLRCLLVPVHISLLYNVSALQWKTYKVQRAAVQMSVVGSCLFIFLLQLFSALQCIWWNCSVPCKAVSAKCSDEHSRRFWVVCCCYCCWPQV